MRQLAACFFAVIVLAAMAIAGQKPDKQKKGEAAPPKLSTTGKPIPQAKTDKEFKAYQDAMQLQDPVAAETAADNFAATYPDSEIRYLLYYKVMNAYQAQNNAEKAIEMGHKVLAARPNEPITLATLGFLISERTQEGDLDRAERLTEALQDSQKALEVLDAELMLPASTPPEQEQQQKKMIRSMAYGSIGTAYLAQGNAVEAEKAFKQSIDALPESPDAIVVLRYAIALDKQKRYTEALAATQRAMQLSPEGSPQHTLCVRERDRLVQLTGTQGTKQPASSGTK
jgi:tetratricopeptide (TPR) repeat protein